MRLHSRLSTSFHSKNLIANPYHKIATNLYINKVPKANFHMVHSIWQQIVLRKYLCMVPSTLRYFVLDYTMQAVQRFKERLEGPGESFITNALGIGYERPSRYSLIILENNMTLSCSSTPICCVVSHIPLVLINMFYIFVFLLLQEKGKRVRPTSKCLLSLINP